jgi:WD40 repeat protein
LSSASKLISASQDKRICIWDVSNIQHRSIELFRNNSLPVHAHTIIRGHSDPVGSFAVLGNTLLSAAASKFSIVPLHQDGMLKINPIKLQNAKTDKIAALLGMPLHRMFVAGFEDGSLRYCC